MSMRLPIAIKSVGYRPNMNVFTFEEMFTCMRLKMIYDFDGLLNF